MLTVCVVMLWRWLATDSVVVSPHGLVRVAVEAEAAPTPATQSSIEVGHCTHSCCGLEYDVDGTPPTCGLLTR